MLFIFIICFLCERGEEDFQSDKRREEKREGGDEEEGNEEQDDLISRLYHEIWMWLPWLQGAGG